MLIKRTMLATLAMRAISALASPVDNLVVQDPTSYLVSDHAYAETVLAEQLAPFPEVLMDDAVFTGIRKGPTDQFLGIPFAYPPLTSNLSLSLIILTPLCTQDG